MMSEAKNVSTYIDTWGLYSLLLTSENATNDGNIHLDDFEALRAINPHGLVFHCVDTEDEFIVLDYRGQNYRVKPDNYILVSDPKFQIFDKVVDPNHPDKATFVRDIFWHSKYKKHMFFVEMNGKAKSKRYFEEDLLPGLDSEVQTPFKALE